MSTHKFTHWNFTSSQLTMNHMMITMKKQNTFTSGLLCNPSRRANPSALKEGDADEDSPFPEFEPDENNALTCKAILHKVY